MPNNAQRDYHFLTLAAEEIAQRLAGGEIDAAKAAEYITSTAYRYAEQQKRRLIGQRLEQHR